MNDGKVRHDLAYQAWENSLRLAAVARPKRAAALPARPAPGSFAGAIDTGSTSSTREELVELAALLAGEPRAKRSVRHSELFHDERAVDEIDAVAASGAHEITRRMARVMPPERMSSTRCTRPTSRAPEGCVTSAGAPGDIARMGVVSTHE